MASNSQQHDLSQLSDDTLVQLFVSDPQRNAKAFEVLVERYQGKVFGLSLRMMGSREEAEDQAQEIFVKVYRSLARFEGRSRFSTWLYRIAVNACLDAIEKRRRRPQAADIEWGDLAETEPVDSELLSRHAPTPEQAYLHKEQSSVVHSALSKLEESHRQAIVQRELQGLSYQDMAANTRIGLSAMKMRVHRARKALASVLQQQAQLGMA
ncbi:MAG: sigma-70 family RNA polymerase sigma factor [Anaerolineae bacterium]|uniref:sigma-70 family RNA polymerase sigma factor n=1 Tax=Candidatus Amarolinea dominans TaxID=3140696 RepID=UPI003134E6C0|nr:sigma-70 family RNA polymerase sigma factor [Anaerolineae bacterium]MBK9092360.1 sigma-70 family RNA polymerase sigma factor [Anaerolineae bacterium]MBK9229346.1 sigma-70 family RNA polymerase sigma factor [Anaerolineae bacterium]